jgi:hypothetical protein
VGIYHYIVPVLSEESSNDIATQNIFGIVLYLFHVCDSDAAPLKNIYFSDDG